MVALVAVVAVLLVALAGGAAGVSTGQVLVVEDLDTGERYVTEPVETGSTVELRYMHSVEKTPVNDVYRVDGETLVNTRMEFESYGWGLPARVNVTNVNGTFVYDPPEPIMTLETLSVSPGRVANHTLIVDDRRIDLVAQTNASDVRIHVERRTLTDVFL
ncbi:DUF1850 domain-containing protein [Halobacterium sp. KA-6]|uniref:DUF1850 domain-containing protein n=1 Tax=Halobacterium sp. KA-6 TaxID=2896368 RepID=UPI001E552063|nr:DUF1850 domain-containing protein [Halobacterium sp. KA-6]MCD2202320.1 DUF1850 domain-containing protein [Halobacterium sp. KA-6]